MSYTSTGNVAPPAEQVELRTLRERRTRVWRGAAMMLLTAATVLCLSLVNRDEAVIRTCRMRMEHARQVLQAAHDSRAHPPKKFPVAEGEERESAGKSDIELHRGHVYYNSLFELQTGGSREVGVACCRSAHTRLFGTCGRHVLVYEPKTERLEIRWQSEDEFRAAAGSLGLESGIKR